MLEYVKSALSSIWSNKVRSVLTVLGVVLGVTSVTTLISLGQGLKNDVSGLIQGFGTNVITIVSGKLDTSGSSSLSQNANPGDFISGTILTESDVEKVKALPEIESVSPTVLVPGGLQYNDKTATSTVTGAYPEVVNALQVLTIDKGQIFADRESGNKIVLGYQPTNDLFGDINPIGKKIKLGKEDFEVVGTLTKAKGSAIFGSSFDSLSVIPFDTATVLNKNQTKINRIIIKASDTAKVEDVKNRVTSEVLANHDNEDNFSVLTQDDILSLFNTFLNLATTMVSAIAAISLVVGGIGIMNIMLVTVTERTREIGLRKAVGATKGAILFQFLTEAVVVTLVGAVIGLGITFITSAIIRAKTDLNPVISLDVIGLAVGIALVVGIIFGLWPAIRAAAKDPIEVLRYE